MLIKPKDYNKYMFSNFLMVCICQLKNSLSLNKLLNQ